MNKLYSILLAPILLMGIFLTNAISENAILTFRLVHPDHDRIAFLQPSKVKIDKKDYEYFKLGNANYWVGKTIELDITDMKDAKLEVLRPPLYNVTIILNKKGQEKFSKLTANNKMRRLAIIFEGNLLTAPIIKEEITGDEVVVSGLYFDDAQKLRDIIKNYSAKSQNQH
jgi:preprotein translocase subunit SecD